MKAKNYVRSTHFLPFEIKKKSIFNKIIGVILLIFTATSFGQEKSNIIEDALLIENEYIHDLQLEKFFLHTNKTSYFPGEKIWFKAYIVNDTDNKASANTSNLHINLYNSQKELVSSTLFLANNGKANGDITLSKEMLAGKYYLEVTTQWNQNFEMNSSITSIDIISSNQNNELNIDKSVITNTLLSDVKTNSIALDFFPQNSVLLENTENTIAFTSNNHETPISISGDVIDDKTGIIMAKLESNSYGMGSFNLFINPERSYTASINYNGGNKKINIPKAQSEGFIIRKNEKQTNDKTINFILSTNLKTLKSNKNKTLNAVLHRNGNASLVIPIDLKKGVLKYSFNLKKEDLYNGINTITAFDKSNTPVSNYAFFYKNQKDLELEITKGKIDSDSLTIHFDLKNEVSMANLSVSILPEETKVHDNKNSILSAFLMAPYLDKVPMNLSEIMSLNNNENLIDLIIATRIKKKSFPYKEKRKLILAENGATIKGNVSANVQDLTGYKVMLSSIDSGILLIQTIGESNSFTFNNLIIKHPSKYKLALLDPQGKIIKTGFRMSNELIAYKASSELPIKTKFLQEENPIRKENNNDISLLPILTDDVNLLNEVKLKLSNYEENINKLKKLGIKSNILDNGFATLEIINDDEFPMDVLDYIRRIAGIKVVGNLASGYSIKNTRGIKSIIATATTEMVILIDGIPGNANFLIARPITDFSAISVNSMGAGLGITGMGGSISFYTKKGNYNPDFSTPNDDILISETDFGFSISENNYKNQMFQYKNNESRKYYGTIGWFPNVDVLPNSTYKLKVDNNGFKDLKIIVNGINAEGKLIYKIVTINSEVL